ncbi:CD209 antigen-like protein C [Stegostoma tigrinum]|uniref:CD209 antigen-like protein C n=1 Tax=Stegostoma tigrinum TaxID=3053191 RepID=UPI002870275A|nr:CD209 antigen-like protein C [Stegostoma tigrinum]
MADEEEEDWYQRRDEDSSLEDEARPRGPLTWDERRHRSRWEDDETSAEDTATSPTESDEGTYWQMLCGSPWKKVAIGSLTIAAVCAIISVILYSEGTRMRRELVSKQVALDYALSNYSDARESMNRQLSPSDCVHYEDTFKNWIQTFCRIINCTSDLCHKSWAPYQGHCYYFSRTILGWEESRQNCISQGAELLVVQSEDEQEFVSEHNRSRAYWIGIKDNPLEATWTWVDGTTLRENLMFWDQNKPDSHFDYELEAFRNCVYLHRGGWSNAVCSSPQYWICKRRSEPPPMNL